MATTPPRTRTRSLLSAVVVAVLAALGLLAPAAQANSGVVVARADLTRQATATRAATVTVADARGRQDGSTQTVRGYVVGQPVGTDSVVTSGFPSDYALALADTAAETATDAMVYVQLPAVLRAAWGLRSNPALIGRQVDVTGPLAAYFAHAGIRGATAVATVGGSTPPPPPSGGPLDDTYYAPAIGTTGATLRTALHDIIDGNQRISYDQVWQALRDTDQDPGNPDHVRTLYSGLSLPKSSNGGDPDDWNREHVWPQSRGGFDTSTGPGTDVHHLRPEDVTVNSTRGNKDFDLGGSSVGQCGGCLGDNDSFEPRDEVKGDVARMMFYMAVRYAGDDGFQDLELADSVSGSVPTLGRLSVLLQWHAQDPVDSFERRRNDRIFEIWQKNRNPFIDHPEWAASIWG